MKFLRWSKRKPVDEHLECVSSTTLVDQVDSRITFVRDQHTGVHVAVRVQLNASPDEVWGVLRDPDCDRVFRNIKVVLYRNVLEDDGMGVRKLEVAHTAIAKLLMFTFCFDTKLLVLENARSKTMQYNVCGSSFLKKYEGQWFLTPLPGNRAPARGPAGQHHGAFNRTALSGLRHFSQNCWHQLPGSRTGARTLLTLEQTMVPALPLPTPIQRCLGEVCCRSVNQSIEDLDRELQRRRGAAQQNNEFLALVGAAWRDASAAASMSLQHFATAMATELP